MVKNNAKVKQNKEMYEISTGYPGVLIQLIISKLPHN